MTGPFKRILVVDDHAIVRRGVRDALADTRFQVVAEASDGPSAKMLSRKMRPDIVILDHAQPLSGGIDLACELKAIHPSLEILIFSMELNEGAIAELIQAGIGAYVCKSEPLDELTAALNALSVHRPHYSKTLNINALERALADTKCAQRGLLTQSETKVVQMIASGRLSQEIAGQLGVSKKTIETHRRNARDKTHCRTTADIVRYAVRNNLIQA